MIDYTAPRTEWVDFEILDNDELLLGTLDRVTGGNLEWSTQATIRTGGRVELTAPQKGGIDWLKVRIRITYRMRVGDDEASWPLGVYLPATPAAKHSSTSTDLPVELYDKLLILHEDAYPESIGFPDGTVVSTTVDQLITQTGEPNRWIEPGSETLRNPMVFEPGTTRLQVINALLDSAGYGALWCDGAGQFRAEKYRPPAARPLAWTFAPGQRAVHVDEVDVDADYFAVPNRLVLIARSDGDRAPLTSTRTLDQLLPDSMFTHANRGRWVTRVDSDVEASSQAVLDGLCERRLLGAVDITRTARIRHAMLPLGLGDRIQIDGVPQISEAVITQMTLPLTAGGLCQSTLRGISG